MTGLWGMLGPARGAGRREPHGQSQGLDTLRALTQRTQLWHERSEVAGKWVQALRGQHSRRQLQRRVANPGQKLTRLPSCRPLG